MKKLPSPLFTSFLFLHLKQLLFQEGFIGVEAVDLEKAHTLFKSHSQFFSKWIEQHMEGSMQYLSKRKKLRLFPKKLFPPTQSIVCALYPYPPSPIGTDQASLGIQYASYLRGADYHFVLKQKWKKVLSFLKSMYPFLKWKICVDTSPVLERLWAALCGLGWIGKNTLLIHPKWGSYVFLSEVFLNISFQKSPHLFPSRCGHCQKCLNLCPAKALLSPRILDARKCISYMTLEHRGTWDSERVPFQKNSNWIAGCDLCQQACPFNQKRKKDPQKGKTKRSLLPFLWEDLFNQDKASYQASIKNHALSRIKYWQFKRNLAALFIHRCLLNSQNPIFKKKWVFKIKKAFLESKNEKEKQLWKKCLCILKEDF